VSEPECCDTRGYDLGSDVRHDGKNWLLDLERPEVDRALAMRRSRRARCRCGHRSHALRLAAAGARVTALDFSDGCSRRRSPSRARARALDNARRDRPCPSPIGPSTVSCRRSCLTHRSDASRAVLPGARRVTRADGRIVSPRCTRRCSSRNLGNFHDEEARSARAHMKRRSRTTSWSARRWSGDRGARGAFGRRHAGRALRAVAEARRLPALFVMELRPR